MTDKCVLLCEDEPSILDLMKIAFRSAGYEPLTAKSPYEGIQKIRGRQIDAVVSDLQLEHGNAFDLISELRRKGLDAPVILTSGAVTPATRERAEAAGVVDVFEKPLAFKDIVDRVDKSIHPAAIRKIGARVLVVEDQPQIRSLLKATLENAGFDVVPVEDGRSALDAVRAASPRIDLALVDMHTPPPSGANLIRDLRGADAGLYVAMITGEATNDQIQAAYAAGAGTLYRKPFSPSALAEAMKSHLPEAREMRQKAQLLEREALEPWYKRAPRWVNRAVLGTGRERKERLVLGGMIAAAAIIGVIVQGVFQTTAETMDGFKGSIDRAARAAERMSDRQRGLDPEFQRWYMMRKLEMEEDRDRYMQQHNDREQRFREIQWLTPSSSNTPSEPPRVRLESGRTPRGIGEE